MPQPKDINAFLKRLGTIEITEVDTGKVTYSATYAVEDILHLFKLGFSVQEVITQLEDAEEVARLNPAGVATLRKGGVL